MNSKTILNHMAFGARLAATTVATGVVAPLAGIGAASVAFVAATYAVVDESAKHFVQAERLRVGSPMSNVVAEA